MNLFQKWAIATLLATLALIFIGGVVRVSGAGLGCPDWPKCWGSWLPPSGLEEVDLPVVLEEFRRKDPTLTEADLVALFDPFKMWVEYLNRLVGVVIGFLVLGTLVLSIPYLRERRGEKMSAVFWGSLASFLLVGFQGWLGGQVVRSGLRQGMITLHLFAALVLFCLLIYVAYRASEKQVRADVWPAVYRWLRPLVLIFFACCSLQILIGSQVREAVDAIADAGQIERAGWLAEVGMIDHVHRIFAWVLLVGGICFFILGLRGHLSGVARLAALLLGILVAAQVFLGIALAYWGFPASAQVGHLGLASAIACLSFYLVLAVREKPMLISNMTATDLAN